MGRAPCCDKATVKKGPWSPEEDAMLKNYIEEHGTGGNWIALPHKIGLKRCGKSCRLRWLNYLRPNIKHGDFTPEEDSLICSLYISIGSRWSIIAAQLPGRTDNDVKNYWNTKLKKRLLGRRGKADHRLAADAPAAAASEMSAENAAGERVLSASAMERIQLCMQLQELHHPLATHHGPLAMWPAAASFNSSLSSDVTVAAAAEQGGPQQSVSSLLGEHHHLASAQQQLEAGVAMDGLAVASPPSSTENSNVVISMEAELEELLYGGKAGGALQQHGDAEWWSYDDDVQGKSSPVSCWDFAPEATSAAVFQDYASVYDI